MHITTGVGTGQSPLVQDLGYGYYPDGKLQNRTDNLLGDSETFSYDNLDRVIQWTQTSGSTVQYGYDDLGNLYQSRSGRLFGIRQ